jgi:hypothetical protein
MPDARGWAQVHCKPIVGIGTACAQPAEACQVFALQELAKMRLTSATLRLRSLAVRKTHCHTSDRQEIALISRRSHSLLSQTLRGQLGPKLAQSPIEEAA